MEDLFEKLKDRESFDAYWNENYVPITYADVKDAYEDFVKASDKHIFVSDYGESGNINRDDFMDNLSQTAQLTFQDSLTEAFYDKNPDLYETAFAIYEEAQMNGGNDENIAATFHEEYNRLYKEFLLAMYDAMF